jgi:rRNA maturation RNase YbeY
MIRYFSEDTTFLYKCKRLTSNWLKKVAEQEGKRIGQISIIFCSDPYLLGINRKYLGHDYYTDIISFDYCEGNLLSGDLFISIDTVRDNAAFYGTTFENELHRVIVHGVLHLIGYDDHSDADTAAMRAAEDRALTLLV